MIYQLTIIPLFFCCLINHPLKAGILEGPGKTEVRDTLLLNSHQPAINAKTSNNSILTPAANKMPLSATRIVLSHHKTYHNKNRREKIEVIAEKVRKIQTKVDKIEARIREIELQDQ